ncbi:unnamed protein product [Arctia plantaginis]|uniref:Ig-like domain-containing protein n=1 Tax=Arctia plantaginis TaxID=874455 RepID=A0A8S0Z8B4_ARCPL|nr:unnamed protein product [Arctia plantaginis]
MRCLYFATWTVLAVYISSRESHAQVPVYVVRINNLLRMQQGIGWPQHLNVVKGHVAMLRLTSTLDNMKECKVFTPTGLHFNVRNPPSNRYQSWSNGCGLKINNVTASDRGRWRFIASKGNESITGWSEVTVVEDTPYAPSDAIALQDGKTHVQVDLTTLQNSYCLVTQPFSVSSLVPGHCRLTLDRTTRAVQGRWTVVLGVPGRVSELQVERNVAVQNEQLVSGYREDATELSLYCNIAHTERNITFCRFQKNAESAGFNIMDGLSDGRRSYYGEGFAKRECGMSIESPNIDDYGTWRCTVGTQEWRGNNIVQSTPMQALIRVVPRDTSRSFRLLRETKNAEDERRVLLVQRDSSLIIMCRAEVSLAYCWFQHPNGSQFTPVERQAEEQRNFWYTGESLQTGDCGINFAHVTEDDAGEWICHMGPRHQLGVEVTDNVLVRVTGPLAANKQEVDATNGGQVTLHCQTANGPRPLDYCRFLTPKSVGISIDSSVTQENAVLGRFYFTPERSLNYGDCSLTINPVRSEDIGQWTCAALVHDDTQESRDTITVVYSDINSTRRPLHRAGIAGMVIGIVLLVIVLAGVVWYKKGKPFPWKIRFRNVENDEFAISFARSSNASDNSVDSQRNIVNS